MTTQLPMIKKGASAQMLAHAYNQLDAAMPGSIDEPPALLLVHPSAWNNRYQSLLYTQAGPRRYVAMGLTHDTSLLREVSWPGPIILHTHWFAGIFASCKNEIEASDRLAKLSADFADFKARTGAKFLWTAHNIIPHGNLFPVTFLKLRQWICETFDAVHVMQAEHVPLLEQAFDRPLPAPFTVRHMLYQGSQADCVSSEAAKVHFGIAPDNFVFAYFGSIHPYKNLERLLNAFDRIAETVDRPITALIGGVPVDAQTVQQLNSRWGRTPRVRLLMETIPDHEIQYIHRAADVMVLPYGETLNSGAAFMAASFNKPFIMPDGLASRALEGLGVTRFDVNTSGALERAMRDVMSGQQGSIDDTASARVNPTVVSETFFDHLDQLLGRTSTRRSAKDV